MADPEAMARSICLRLLTRRAHTRAELAAALAKRGVPIEASDAVLERFDDVGLIDDAAFAQAWTASRQRSRGLSSRAIAAELRSRGVGGEDIEQALSGVTADDERERAAALVARRLPSLRGHPPAVQARRLVGMLARKGYGAGLAHAVVREAIASAGEVLDDYDVLADDDE